MRQRFSICVLSLLLILAAEPAFGGIVSRQSAREFAANYMGVSSPVLVAQCEAYYVFDNPDGGWVIIAASDCATPVLGHSDTGHFPADRMPVNMKRWLGRASSNIVKAEKASLRQTAEVKAAWATEGHRTKAAGSQVLLQTARWDQGTPYNATLKEQLNTTRAVHTGCVATAMAIVLRYHKHPAQGSGTIGGYTSRYSSSETYRVPSVNISSYRYDWDNMPLTDGNVTTWTSAQKKAVADLMFHCGAMVGMTYSYTGSGAYASDIIPALVEHMGYSGNAVELYRDNYSNYDWLRILKAEIDSDRPVIYGGSDESDGAGHQFVLDGYNSNDEVHINWGWGGAENAWYAVNYLGSHSTGVYNYYDNALIGLEPAKQTYSTNPEIFFLGYTDDGYDDYGIKLVSDHIEKGVPFALDMLLVSDNPQAQYKGKIRGVLMDRHGVLKEIIGEETPVTLTRATDTEYGEAEINKYTCTIGSDIAPGDYVAIQQTWADGSWKTVGAMNHNDSDPYYTYFSVGKISATGISYIYLPDTIKTGQILYPDFVSSGRLHTGVEWLVDGKSLANGYYKATAGKHSIKLTITYSKGLKETVTANFSVTN